MALSPQEFRRLVSQAIASLPFPIAERMKNVEVVGEDRPTRAELAMAGGDTPGTTLLCASCAKPLPVRYDYAHIRARLNRYSLKTSPIKALKYLDFYPILNLDLVVSLDEGGTPLYRCHRLGGGGGGKTPH